MPTAHPTDVDLSPREVVDLASPDAITAFLPRLGYDTADRAALTPEAVGLSGESASAVKSSGSTCCPKARRGICGSYSPSLNR